MASESPAPMKARALLYSDYSSDNTAVQFEQVDVGPPGPGQVVVKVCCAAVNPIDLKLKQGSMKDSWRQSFPFTMGYDLSGTVVSVGSDVSEFNAGDEVFAVNWGKENHGPPGNTHADSEGPVAGAFAEYCLVEVSKLSHKPAELSHEIAAAMSLVGTTANDCLDEVQVGEGDRILILAGATAVGSIAIQLAKLRGAHVTTTSSKRTIDYVGSLNPDRIIDYTASNWWEDEEIKGLDAIFDCVGEASGFEHAKLVLKEDGKFISIASFEAGFDPTAHSPLTYAAFHVLSNNTKTQDTLAQLVLDGKLRVTINKRFPFTLEGAQEMLLEQAGGKSMGKNVLVVSE